MGVLVTRPLAEAERTAARLRAMGLVPVVAPVLAIEPRGMGAARADAVLLTSGNAVAGAVAAVAGTAVPVLAVGDATAARARAAGCEQVESAGGDADALVALARRRCAPGASLLLACGAGQGTELAVALRAAGFRVRRRVAYAARPVAAMPAPAVAALEGGSLRAALFLSADTARAFAALLPADLVPALAEVEALAIGPPAASVLRELPWARVRVALTPALDGLLTML